MKTITIVSLVLGVLAWSVFGRSGGAALDVHEWGTFTVVSGSDGQPIQWYQPEEALSELPDFVYPRRQATNASLGGTPGLRKTGAGVLILNGSPSGFFVRMETPVLYFYPEKPMPVAAQVTMKNGFVTEWFPHFTPSAIGATPTEHTVTWDGELLAPSDAETAKLIPAVAGTRGAHYAHAREVPDAWQFRATKTNEADKFIFYRGAGNALPPYRVHALPNSKVLLSHAGDGGEIVSAFVLEVQANGARWAKLDALPAMKDNQGQTQVSAPMNTPLLPLVKAQTDLAAAMRDSLASAGLSVDEAKAMVATWRDVWFTEQGTRVLALLPRPWVDSVLPLKITPTPATLNRVFVARFEVFTPEREQSLLTLLFNADEKSGSMDKEKFRALHFDRFANAALARSQQLGEERIRQRFVELQKSPAAPATAAR